MTKAAGVSYNDETSIHTIATLIQMYNNKIGLELSKQNILDRSLDITSLAYKLEQKILNKS